MSTPGSADVYRNLTRKTWSVRVEGRVVGHLPAIALVGVTLRASEAARLRCMRTGCRDVHAWARGLPLVGVPRPGGAVSFGYRLSVSGFRLADGTPISSAAAVWLEADGAAWALAPRSE